MPSEYMALLAALGKEAALNPFYGSFPPGPFQEAPWGAHMS